MFFRLENRLKARLTISKGIYYISYQKIIFNNSYGSFMIKVNNEYNINAFLRVLTINYSPVIYMKK